MKLLRFFLLGFAFCCFLNNAQSQQLISTNGGCGVAGISPWFDWYRQNRDFNVEERSADTTVLYVPVTIHIIGRDNGSGYFPFESAMRVICEMNEQYKPSYIRYYLHPDEPILYHNNSTWYEHDWNGGADMIASTQLNSRINAYVVQDPAGNCGYSGFGGIVLGKNCSGPGNSTWAHEAGHHLSLPHPFLGWEGSSWNWSQPAPQNINGSKVEKLNGSNCQESGDYFCDTRPDYISDRWSCDGNFESIVTLKDPNGQTFKADATVIMGYALDACASRFSAEQTAAMRDNLNSEHSDYLQVSEEGTMLDDNANVELASPLDSVLTPYNNAKLVWNSVPGATMYIVQASIQSNFASIQVNQGIFNDTTFTITKNIPNNRLIYWRVKAYNNWDLCQPNAVLQVGIFKTFIGNSATTELGKLAAIELTPNLVSGGSIANLSVESEESFEARLFISDASGKVVRTQNVRVTNGSNNFEIDTNTLAAGIYQVALQTSKGISINKMAVAE